MNDEQVLLAIETSGKSGSVAILRRQQGQWICEMEVLSPDSGSAKTLAPAIQKIMSSNSVDMKRISAIALLTGPGSFTGLRVGVATTKAMAYALNLPTIEIDTLDVIAHQCPVFSDSVFAILDAYRGQVFLSEYSIQPAESTRLVEKRSPTEIVDIERLLERAMTRLESNQTIELCGPGCERVRKFLAASEVDRQQLASRLEDRIRWIDEEKTTPNAESVAWLGFAKWKTGNVLSPFELQPRYYRGSAAEELIAKPN
jgi:tRNA threonylcarbamoyladenosine biosynthesis protein TsaB